MQDFSGKLNASLNDPTNHFSQSGLWKKQRVVVVIPAGESIPAKVALSHWNLIFPPNQGVVRLLAQGMEVGHAYSTAIEAILAHPDLQNWEYILTLEHDNMPPPEGILRLIESMEKHPELACISGLYWTKGPEGVPQIWGDPKEPVLNFRPQQPILDQLVECTGVGMGMALYRMSMFKDTRLARPWFKTLAGVNGVGTQDLIFWTDARKYGYRCAVDCSVRVGHYDSQADIVW